MKGEELSAALRCGKDLNNRLAKSLDEKKVRSERQVMIVKANAERKRFIEVYKAYEPKDTGRSEYRKALAKRKMERSKSGEGI